MGDGQVDELKEEIQELKDELERLKQEKQSNKGSSSRSVDAVEDEIEEVQEQFHDIVESSSGWSRRDFMKLMGGGAAGLGAAAMLPSLASAFKVESDNALEYLNKSGVDSPSFSVTPGGNVTAPQLGEPNNRIQDIYASSVTTDKIHTTEWAMAPKFTISFDPDRTPELVINNQNGGVEKSSDDRTDLATLIQEIDDSLDNRWVAEFVASGGNKAYRIDQQIQLENNVYWRGAERNFTSIRPTSDLTNDMIVLNDPNSTQIPITTFERLKFVANNVSIGSDVSCIRNVNHNELILRNTEIRSFTNHGLDIAPASGVELRWNYALGSWFLDSDGSDVHFDGSANGTVQDWTFTGCQFQPAGGNAMYFDNTGTSVAHLW